MSPTAGFAASFRQSDLEGSTRTAFISTPALLATSRQYLVAAHIVLRRKLVRQWDE